MAASEQDSSLALYCDFENVALGARDARIAKFDMKPVLERLLLRGSIVVKKAYCDWDRYKEFKGAMHEASFELIEIPHTRMSGKNSADIRMVVDALDLCYTKDHIDTFVIISGDSDFSPLVSKLRENAKTVVGVGIRNSTSDLLVSACDEFIYYDDLVAATSVVRKRRRPAKAKTAEPASGAAKKKEAESDRLAEAMDQIVETIDALLTERDDSVWGSQVKQTLKRRNPGFSESALGFRSFNGLLIEMKKRGLLELEPDERSGGVIITSTGGDG